MLKFSATKMSVAEIKITAGIYVGIYIKNIHAVLQELCAIFVHLVRY